MNVFINILSNSIILSAPGSKKKSLIFKEFSYTYSLKTSENKVRALNETLTEENLKEFGDDKIVSLIVPDDQVFIGMTLLPLFSAKKIHDTFETTFKVDYPDFKDYFINYEIYGKTNSNSIVLYRMTRISHIDEIKKALYNHGLTLKNINYFSNYVFSNNKANQNRIVTKLIVGEHESELIIYNGSITVCHSIIEIGKSELLDNDEFIESFYNIDNELANKYASFHKVHFDSKNLLTDDIIRNNEVHESFIPAKPKELRFLKGASLQNYQSRQKYLKLHAFVMDNVNFYMQEPWFFPVHDVEVVCDDDVYAGLLTANTGKEISYIKSTESFASYFSNEASNNLLFSSKLNVKERRKIDWGKFLTMEIGGKKKKA